MNLLKRIVRYFWPERYVLVAIPHYYLDGKDLMLNTVIYAVHPKEALKKSQGQVLGEVVNGKTILRRKKDDRAMRVSGLDELSLLCASDMAENPSVPIDP